MYLMYRGKITIPINVKYIKTEVLGEDVLPKRHLCALTYLASPRSHIRKMLEHKSGYCCPNL
jgi:hypothetical protein